MNIFEQASRDKLRFVSNKGLISIEDLWDLPLTSKGGFDLDSVARNANAAVKAAAEESFVAPVANPGKALLDLRLEVVKHVIAVRLKENEDARTKAARAAERARLIDALANKQDEKLRTMTTEEVQARIAELDRAGV